MDFQITINTILCIVILIVPGIFLKRFYFQGKFSTQFENGLFADRLISSIFLGILVQLLMLGIFSKWLDFTYSDIKKPISDYYSQLLNNNLPDFTVENLKYALYYIFFSLVISICIGICSHHIVRLLRLDRTFEFLRFHNYWHYYFKGEILSTREFRSPIKTKVLFTLVDVLFDNPTSDTNLYSGILSDYSINHKTGDLEFIYLTNAKRYSKKDVKFKDIPGDILILPYNRIVNINLRFFKDEKSKIRIFSQVVLPLFYLFSLLFIIIGPWFLNNNLSIIRTITGIVVTLLIWVLSLALIWSKNNPNSPLEKEGKRLTIQLLIGLIVIDIFIFKLISIWEILASIFEYLKSLF